MSHGSTDPIWPEQWRSHEPAFAGPMSLNVAGFDVAVRVGPAELHQVYFPLVHRLEQKANLEQQRVLAALAGIPGGGKSTFAAVLERVAAAVLGPGRLMVVGMDGWHWPNAVLDARTTTDAHGRAIPLRRRKGGPESYDVEALAAAIDRLRDTDSPVALPVYDRRLHDPVPGGLIVPPDARIVIIEGNFLLSTDPPWDQVSSRLSPRLFLDCDPARVRARIVARHVRGGAGPDEAARKYENNDRLNIEAVLATRPNADLVIDLGPPARLRN